MGHPTMTNIVLLAVLVTQVSALLQSPPRMVKQPPPDELLFKVAQIGEVDKPFIIECEAEGEPVPSYKWIKNGKKFDWQAYDTRMLQQPGRGTLTISAPRDEDLGQYQCFAENEWGIATSNSVFVRKSELNSFKEQPAETVTADEGDPFKLTCHPPDGWPKPNVYWMLQGEHGEIKTINNSRMTLDPEGNLWFSNVTREDASINHAYTCSAKSSFRNEYKLGNKVYLNVVQNGIAPGQNKHEPVRQYVSRRLEVAVRGKPVELFCIYGGTPLPQTVWKKNGVILRSSERIQQSNYGKSLLLKRAEYEDEGSYTCEVSNGVGSAQTYSIQLSIQAVPFFTVEPQQVNAAEDEEAVIRCEAEGTPEPQIKWIHNGRPIEEAPPNDRRTVENHQITIRHLTKKDTGNYGCNATNALGYVYKDIYINVQSVPPEIVEPPKNVTTVDGTTVTMTCRVFGAPRPIVKWLRDGVELTGGRYNTTADGDLVIRDVGFQDVGAYQCYAKNKFDEKSAFGSLAVKKHTVITDRPEDYEVAAGTEATFRCNAVADESVPLTISWLHKGQPIELESEPRFLVTNDYSLLITRASELDSGDYTCVASTPLDEARAQATLTVQASRGQHIIAARDIRPVDDYLDISYYDAPPYDVPNPPVLESIRCEERQATLKWRPMGDNRAPILFFRIEYNTSFTPEIWEPAFEQVPAIDTSYAIALTPWANYTFRVKASNKIGESAASGHSEVCTTQPDVPYKNPDNVEGKGTDPTNMLISWSMMPQIEHHAPGFHYRVNWKRNIDGALWTTEDVHDWRQTQLLLRNQPTFQEYKIKVVAHNSKGESNIAATEVLGYSGEDVPTQAPGNFTLVQILSPTEALLSFTPVDPATVRGHFKGYKLQTWTDRGGESDVRETLLANDAVNALVNKFVPYSRNNARVLVYNGRYNGPPSATLSFTMPEGTPGTVRTFEAHPIGSSAMLLKWERPEHPNGVLTGYKVTYREVKGTDLAPIQERKAVIDPKMDRAKLAGLRPNTKYRVMIKAMTKAGEGEEYYVEQTTKSVLSSEPDIPIFDVSLLPSHDGLAKVLVRWMPSLDGHSGSHFTAKYRVKGEPRFLETEPELAEDWLVIPALQPSQTYEVRVVAIDGNYFRESDSKEIDTTIDGPVIMPPEKVATAGWFIGAMLALAFLLLVLVLVCVARRNRGGKYDVHDRELARGRHDYSEGGFHEYTHPLDSKSRQSMSSNKPGPESDTDSMAEYGEGETARFTEDGSFIGQYVPGASVLRGPPAPAPGPGSVPLSPPSPPSRHPPTYV